MLNALAGLLPYAKVEQPEARAQARCVDVDRYRKCHFCCNCRLSARERAQLQLSAEMGRPELSVQYIYNIRRMGSIYLLCVLLSSTSALLIALNFSTCTDSLEYIYGRNL